MLLGPGARCWEPPNSRRGGGGCRDIKPANALLAKNKEVLKLADLGLCEGEEPQHVRSIVMDHFGQSATAVEGEKAVPVTEIVGTFRYMPPEVSRPATSAARGHGPLVLRLEGGSCHRLCPCRLFKVRV